VLKSITLALPGGEYYSLRVIGGTLKGRKLFSPKGMQLRPTSDRVKEAIFDILQDRFQGRNVLDLFAGTGALGIEALSRGARKAVFVEGRARSRMLLRRNIEACRLEEKAEVLPREVQGGIKILEKKGETFDIIFMDPPYGQGWVQKTLRALSQSAILAPQGLIVAEHSSGEDLPSVPPWERIDRRKYGGTEVSFFRKKEKE